MYFCVLSATSALMVDQVGRSELAQLERSELGRGCDSSSLRDSCVPRAPRDLAYSRYGQESMGSMRRHASLGLPMPPYRTAPLHQHHRKLAPTPNFLSV